MIDRKKWLVSQWDRVAAIALTVGAGLALLLGWDGAGSSGLPAEQLPYLISGGIGGLMLVGIGATMWLSADLRDEWHKLDRLERAISALEAGLHPLVETTAPDRLADSNGASGLFVRSEHVRT